MMDILFFGSCLKRPSSHFNILNYVTSTNTSTRSSGCFKLVQHLSKTTKERHFYLHRLPRLWNSLPVINIQCLLKSIKRKLLIISMEPLYSSLQPRHSYSALITLYVPAPPVLLNQSPLNGERERANLFVRSSGIFSIIILYTSGKIISSK